MGEKENMKEINKITYIFVKLSRHLPGIYLKNSKMSKCHKYFNKCQTGPSIMVINLYK
jgi:hypothetical protein